MVVLLRGCPLGCRWCQSPESRARTQDLLYDLRLCLEGYELCVRAVLEVIEPALDDLLIHWEKLTPEHFTALTDRYLTQALAACGEVKSVKGIMTTVLHGKPFCDRSDDGLTLFNGESFIQPEMVVGLPQASHEVGIYTTAEICLHVPWKCIAPSLSYIDLFLADLKYVADALFKQWTGGDAARVLDNLKKPAVASKKITIHVSLIQGFNVDKASVEAITDFAVGELHVSGIHSLPYHTLGINKYHLLNLPYDVPEKPLNAPELFDFAQQHICQKRLIATLRG